MSAVTTTFAALVAAVVFWSQPGGTEASCSPCPFQWSEHQHHCYRYFPTALPYDTAEEYCRSEKRSRYSGGLASLDSLEEAAFLMDHVGRILSQLDQAPEKIWLGNQSNEVRANEDLGLIYSNSLNALGERDGNFTSCNTSDAIVAFKEVSPGVGTSGLVPAPALVPSKCGTYVGQGAFIDLGDFAGNCVADPDACTDQTVTWSVWMKIDPLMLEGSGNRYFISMGGRTFRGRGISVLLVGTTQFRVGVRSQVTGGSWVKSYAIAGIPFGEWFHLAFVVDVNFAGAGLFVYMDGVELPDAVPDTRPVSADDLCTRLYVGSPNPCNGVSYSEAQYVSSAAYSHLMVFDNALTSAQIQALYACGSLDWGLKISSLHLDATHADSDSLRYVCEASASTGPTIDWGVYHADQAEWEDLGPSSGPGVDITPTSLSTCVVQSVLVIDRSRGPSSEGDIIACTATDGSGTASVYFRKGAEGIYTYSNQDSEGITISKSGEQSYKLPKDGEKDLGNHPFICEKE